jgi:hypothetical protein
VKSEKSAQYLAPAIQGRIVTFRNDGDLPPHVVIENYGTGASASIIFQESDNGTNWTNIPSTTNQILPGASVGLDVVSTSGMLALMAGGNVPLEVTVIKQVNGSPPYLGSAI